MSHPPTTKLDPALLALALLLLWGVLAPNVACTSRATDAGSRLDRHDPLEAR